MTTLQQNVSNKGGDDGIGGCGDSSDDGGGDGGGGDGGGVDGGDNGTNGGVAASGYDGG